MLPDWMNLSLAGWIAFIVALCWILGPILHWLTHPQWKEEEISLPEALRQIWKAEVVRPPRGDESNASEVRATAACSCEGPSLVLAEGFGDPLRAIPPSADRGEQR